MQVLFCQNKEYRDTVLIWDASTPEKKSASILDMWAKMKQWEGVLFDNLMEDLDATIERSCQEVEKLNKMKNDMDNGIVPEYCIDQVRKEVL